MSQKYLKHFFHFLQRALEQDHCQNLAENARLMPVKYR